MRPVTVPQSGRWTLDEMRPDVCRSAEGHVTPARHSLPGHIALRIVDRQPGARSRATPEDRVIRAITSRNRTTKYPARPDRLECPWFAVAARSWLR